MSKWFCFDSEGLSGVVKIAAFDAGYLVAKKNKNLIEKATPIAVDILKAIEGKTSTESLNVIFKDAVNELIEQVDDPMIKMNILAVLDMVKFNPQFPEVTVLTDAQIKGFIESFLAGAKAVK